MATSYKTVVTYALDGATVEFDIPYQYLARRFVVVSLLPTTGEPRVLVMGTDYRFVSKTRIALNVAWGSNEGFNRIELRRVTSATDRVVDFSDGSILRAYDLNTSQLQALHVAEEGREQTIDLSKQYAEIAGDYAGQAKDSADNSEASYRKVKDIMDTAGDRTTLVALADEDPARGDAFITVKHPKAGGVKRTQHNKNRDVLTGDDFGIVGDGVTDDTAALRAASQVAYDENRALFLTGDILITGDVTFYREVLSDGSLTIRGFSDNTDQPPTVSVYFARKQNIENLTFIFVHVRVRPSTTPIITTLTDIKRCSFINAPLWLGQDEAITGGYNIYSNRFTYQHSREHNSITLTNVNHVTIENNQSQDSKNFVHINPTRSFAAQNIRIENNRASGYVECAVRGSGTSMFRIVKLTIKNNTFSQGVRDIEIMARGSIFLTYAVDLDIDGNSLSGRNDQISLSAVLTGRIQNNTLHVGGTQVGVRARACSHMLMAHNVIQCQTIAFAALIGSASLNPVIPNVTYPSKEWVIRDNTINLLGSGIKIENTDGCQVYNNSFTSTGVAASNGQLFFGGGMTRTFHYGNQHIAASGTPVGNQSGANVVNGMPEMALKAQAVTPISVSAPTITDNDPSMSGARSYVFTFTLGHYTQLRHLANQLADKKTLSQWMATVGSGVTLAWNASAWRIDRSLLPDIVANGVMTDTYSTEYYGTFRSLMVIDQLNRLTCRNFMGSYADSVPLMIGAGAIAEKAWQAANFRSPLVVDGAIYSPVPTGLLPESGWSSDLSGRMALGQRSDGTFILVCCDGTSGSSGSTMLQVAQKMQAMGALNAFNLDGGGSTTLWYNGSILNRPSDPAGERAVPSVMYV